jgi:hypothetical protein
MMRAMKKPRRLLVVCTIGVDNGAAASRRADAMA